MIKVRALLFSGVAVAIWIFVSIVIVRPLIVSAYNGQSLPFLNGIISGQAKYPVEHYLAIWNNIVWQVTLATLGLIGFLIVISWFKCSATAQRCLRRCLHASWVLGAALIALNVAGLIPSLRQQLVHDAGFGSPANEYAELTPDQAMKAIRLTAAIPDESERVTHLTKIVHDATAHLWFDEFPFDQPNVVDDLYMRIPWWENWILYALGRLYPGEYGMYEFEDPNRALERGFGYCSQVSFILHRLLHRQGIDAEVISFPRHVVVEAHLADRSILADPDFGLTLPGGVVWASANTSEVAALYSEHVHANGWSRSDADTLGEFVANIFAKNEAQVYGRDSRAQKEERFYQLKWWIPFCLVGLPAILFKISAIRRRTRVSDSTLATLDR